MATFYRKRCTFNYSRKQKGFWDFLAVSRLCFWIYCTAGSIAFVALEPIFVWKPLLGCLLKLWFQSKKKTKMTPKIQKILRVFSLPMNWPSLILYYSVATLDNNREIITWLIKGYDNYWWWNFWQKPSASNLTIRYENDCILYEREQASEWECQRQRQR